MENNELSFLKKYNESIIYAVVSLLLVATFFVKEIVFLLLFFLVFGSIIFKSELMLYLIVFLFPFQHIISWPISYAYYFVSICFYVMIAKNYIIYMIKNKIKLSPIKLIILSLILCYILFFPTHSWSTHSYIVFFNNLLLTLFSYLYKHKLSFVKLVRLFSLSLIITGLLWFLREKSEVFIEFKFVANGMTGGFTHPNYFAYYETIALSSLLYCFYKKQMSVKEFMLIFIVSFTLGYMTLSRSFLLCIISLMVTVSIFLIKRDGKEAFQFLLPFTAILLLICLIFSNVTTLFVDRINNFYETETMKGIADFNEEDWKIIYEGKKHYDPGRIGLWYIYIRYLLTHPLFLFFGRGFGAVKLGQMKAHNLFLDVIYNNGIVGFILYIVFFLLLLGDKKLKNVKNYLDIIIIFIPYIIFTILDPYIFNMSIIFIILFEKIHNNELEINDGEEKMYKMLKIKTKFNQR